MAMRKELREFRACRDNLDEAAFCFVEAWWKVSDLRTIGCRKARDELWRAARAFVQAEEQERTTRHAPAVVIDDLRAPLSEEA